ncbi:MAG: 3-hydroxyacyl-CoA dehydrogenase [Pseudomonadota bacterium]
MDVKDKVAVVTGGASGLGEATVRRIAAAGGKAMIFDLNAERGNAIAEELGDAIKFSTVNVTDEASVEAAIAATMEAFGAIHICCNFAGIGNAIKTVGKDGPFPLDKFKLIIDINLIGTFNVLRLAANEMQKNEPHNQYGGRGCIINTASVAAYEGQMGQAAYSASKGGVVGMTLPIARDLSRELIRVNTILPGIFNTPLLAAAPENVKQALGAQVPNPARLGNPEEYASLAVEMCKNGYFNGEDVRLDGAIRMAPR